MRYFTSRKITLADHIRNSHDLRSQIIVFARILVLSTNFQEIQLRHFSFVLKGAVSPILSVTLNSEKHICIVGNIKIMVQDC